MGVDQVLSLFLRIVGVDEAARGFSAAAAGIDDLSAAAAAGAAGVDRLDSSTADLAKHLAAVRAAGVKVDLSGLTALQTQIAGVGNALGAIESKHLDIKAGGTEGLRAGFSAIARAINESQARLAAMRSAIEGVDDSPAVINLRRQFDTLQESIAAARARLGQQLRIHGLDEAAVEAKRNATLLQQSADTGRRAFDALVTGAGPLGKVVGALTAVGVAAAVARTAFDPLARAIAAPIKAAAESEVAVARLNIALSSVGQYTGEASRELQQFAADVQASTGQSDEAVLGAIQVLTQIGGVRLDRIREATGAAIDLSAALGVDLSSSALILAKAAEENDQALRRLGITIDDSIPKAQKFDAVLDQVRIKLHGTAVGEAQTAAGSFRLLARAWGEVLEAFGRPFLDPLAALARSSADAANKISGAFPTEQTGVERLRELRVELERLAKIGPEAELAQRGLIAGFELLRLPKLKIAIDRGNADELAAFLKEAQTGIAAAQRDADKLGEAFFTGIRDLVATAIKVRVDADTTDAESAVRKLSNTLRPPDVVVRFRANLDAVTDAVRDVRKEAVRLGIEAPELDQFRQELQAPLAPIRIPFLPEVSTDDLIVKVRAAATDAVAATELPALIADIVPRLDQEKFDAFSTEFLKAIQRVAQQGGEAAVAAMRLLAPTIAAFFAAGSGRASLLVDAPAVESLRPLLDVIRQIRAEASKDPGLLLRLPDLSDTATATDAIAALRRELAAMRSTANIAPEQAARIFEQLEDAVNKAAKAVPSLRGVLEQFLTEQQKAFGIDIKARVSTVEARREVAFFVAQTQDALRAIQANPIRIADVGSLQREGQTVQRVAAQMALAVDEVIKAGDVDQVANLFERMSAAEQANAIAAEKWSADTQRAVEAASQRLRDFLVANAPLFEARRLQREFDVAIRLRDPDRADDILAQIQARLAELPENSELRVQVLADLDALTALRAQMRQLRAEEREPIELAMALGDPERVLAELQALREKLQAEGRLTVEVDADLKNYRRRIAEVRRFSRAAFEQARDDAKVAFQDIGLDAVADAIRAPYTALIDQTRNLKDVVVGIIQSMVDAMIRELARLAALKILQFILGGVPTGGGAAPGIGGGIPLGGGRVGGKPTAEKLPAQPAPIVPRQAAPVPVDIRAIRPAPITVTPEVAVSPQLRVGVVAPDPVQINIGADVPDEVRLPAPPVSVVGRLRDLSLAAPRARAAALAALTLAAPVTKVAALSDQKIGPPRVSIASLAPVRQPAPALRVAPFADVSLDAPDVTIGRVAPIQIPAPQLAARPRPVEVPAATPRPSLVGIQRPAVPPAPRISPLPFGLEGQDQGAPVRALDRAVRALRAGAAVSPVRVQEPEPRSTTADFLRSVTARGDRRLPAFTSTPIADLRDITDRILPPRSPRQERGIVINGPMDSRDIERSLRSGPLGRSLGRLSRSGRLPI